MMRGGLSEQKPATTEVQQICDKVRADVQTKLGETLNIYDPVSYATQVVAGTMFFVKIRVADGNNGYILAKIFKPLPQTNQNPQLLGIQKGKSEGDDLAYF